MSNHRHHADAAHEKRGHHRHPHHHHRRYGSEGVEGNQGPPPPPDDPVVLAARADQLDDAIADWLDQLPESTDATPISPLAKPAVITSEFGPRIQPRPGASANHIGIDFEPADCSHQSDIVGVMPARVLYAGEWNHRMGYAIFIGGDDGVVYVYGHLEPGSILVKQGDRISQGQVIAALGHSGNTTGPDLHFEVRRTPYGIGPTMIEDTDQTVVAQGTTTPQTTTDTPVPPTQPQPSTLNDTVAKAAKASVAMLAPSEANAAPAPEPTFYRGWPDVSIDQFYHDQLLTLDGQHLIASKTNIIAPREHFLVRPEASEDASYIRPMPGDQLAMWEPDLLRPVLRYEATRNEPHHGLEHRGHKGQEPHKHPHRVAERH